MTTQGGITVVEVLVLRADDAVEVGSFVTAGAMRAPWHVEAIERGVGRAAMGEGEEFLLSILARTDEPGRLDRVRLASVSHHDVPLTLREADLHHLLVFVPEEPS